MKICISVELGDIIMVVKFKFEKFQGFLCHRGQSSPFAIDFACRLIAGRYRAACDDWV